MWIASSLRLVGLRAHVRSWIRDEAVAIRHLHFRQSLRIHDVVVANDGVEIQDVGRDRIDLGWFQETRFVERHRAIDVVPQRRGIWPEAADGLEGPRGCKSSLPANENRAHVALRLWPVTSRTLCGEHLASGCDSTRTFRQARAIRRYRRAEFANFLWAGRPSDGERRGLRRERSRCRQHREHREDDRATPPHWSPSRPRGLSRISFR